MVTKEALNRALDLFRTATVAIVLLVAGCSVTHSRLSSALEEENRSAPPPGELESRSRFSFRVLATGLDGPFSMEWEPDGRLWITERQGKRVAVIDPGDGSVFARMLIPEEVNASSSQAGLLGFAFAPSRSGYVTPDFLYLAYTYGGRDGREIRTKIARFHFDKASLSLTDRLDVLTNLPGSTDHNGGRLRSGSDGTLYYTIGDQGSNQLDHYCNPILSQAIPDSDQVARQDWSRYAVKILRLNPDGSIPSNNPMIHGVRSHVYAYGFRNPQGLVFGPDGTLYSSEQGPRSDDEVNVVRSGGNYGWPLVQAMPTTGFTRTATGPIQAVAAARLLSQRLPFRMTFRRRGSHRPGYRTSSPQ